MLWVKFVLYLLILKRLVWNLACMEYLFEDDGECVGYALCPIKHTIENLIRNKPYRHITRTYNLLCISIHRQSRIVDGAIRSPRMLAIELCPFCSEKGSLDIKKLKPMVLSENDKEMHCSVCNQSFPLSPDYPDSLVRLAMKRREDKHNGKK